MLSEVDKFVKSGRKIENTRDIDTRFGTIHLIEHPCFEPKNYKFELIEQ